MTSMPIIVAAKPIELPKDLYIPPEALEVLLETFQGPLDLLLYLIKKQDFDILTIPVAEITHQYMAYIDLMTTLKIELAADYLVMAALLTEIKSRWLLPQTTSDTTEESDPRAELIRRLKAYEQIKLAAESLDQLPQRHRDITWATIPVTKTKRIAEVELSELVTAFLKVMQQAALYRKHAVTRENFSLPERINSVLNRLRAYPYVEFTQLFHYQEGKAGVIITFIAILELLKQSKIAITLSEQFFHIRIINES